MWDAAGFSHCILRALRVAKVSLDHVLQDFYQYLYSVKILVIQTVETKVSAFACLEE
jgi:hypothetical protein